MWYFFTMNLKSVSTVGCFVFALIVCGYAGAQAINIDIGVPGVDPRPSSAFAGVSGQAGFWHQSLGDGEHLTDINGVVTAAAIGASFISPVSRSVPIANEDERRLFSSAAVFGFGRTEFHLAFLTPGWYDVYVYCWGGPGYRNPDISLTTSESFLNFATNLSLPWPGEQVRGITYVQGRVYSTGGLLVNYDLPFTGGFAPISGVQVVPVPGPGSAPILLAAGLLAVRRRRG